MFEEPLAQLLSSTSTSYLYTVCYGSYCQVHRPSHHLDQLVDVRSETDTSVDPGLHTRVFLKVARPFMMWESCEFVDTISED